MYAYRAATREFCGRTAGGHEKNALQFLFLVSLCVVPASAQILCPFLKAPSELFGVEDVPINVQEVWNTTVATVGEKPAFRMYNLDQLDCQYQDRAEITEEKLNFNAPNNSRDAVVLKVSVQTGRVWLEYLRCRDESGTVINEANFTESIQEIKSFEIEGLFHEINCILQFVVFQTLVDGNTEVHIAQQGAEPFVVISVGPRCEGGPVECGANFGSDSEVRTVMRMAPVNDLPRFESCPTTRLATDAQDLSWETSDGNLACQNAATYVGGPVIRNPPGSGAQAPPTRISPPFCQLGEVAREVPPHCDLYRNIPRCLADSSSFVYHIEDEDDAKLEIDGLRMKDPDLWDGHVAMQWTLRFSPGQSAERGNDDPVPPLAIPLEEFYTIQSQLEIMNDYCARPAYNKDKRASQLIGNKHCSQATTDSLGGVFVPKNEFGQDSFDKLQIKVRERQDRTPEEGECRVVLDGTPRHAICAEVRNDDFELVNCICTSRVYERLDTANGTVWKSIMFFEIIELDTFEVFETGYFIMTYTSTDIMHGQMWADSGVRPWAGGTTEVDLFMASPFTISGTVDTAGGDSVKMQLVVETDPDANPKFAVALSSRYGIVSMPNAKVRLTTDTPQRKTFLGTIDEVNEAIYHVQYQLPSADLPSLHTMARQHALYGEGVRETITLSIDDQGYSGRPAAVTGTTFKEQVVGTATVLEYDVVVVADNDAPVISNPTESYSVPENTWMALPGFTISDVDATDVLINVVDKSAIEMRMTVECGNGAMRIDEAAAAKLLFTAPLSVRCERLCQVEAIASLEERMALPAECAQCVQEDALLLMHPQFGLGARQIVVYGSVADLDQSLQALMYKADAGFNSEVPPDSHPFGEDGCPQDFMPGVSGEAVTVSLDDIGNVGCRTTQSKTAVLSRTIVVEPAEDPPRMTFEGNGRELCPVCIGCTECPASCTGWLCTVPLLSTSEDSVLRFRGSQAVSIRDYDTSEVTFGDRVYELTVNSTYGFLALVNGPGVTMQPGFEGCVAAGSQCPVVRMRGSLCDMNAALQRIEYRPSRDYNSQFGTRDQLWFGIDQLGLAHAPVLLYVMVDVAARNDQPLLNLWLSGGTEYAVRSHYLDFYVPRDLDAVPAACGSGLACLHIGDPDACEAKYFAHQRMVGGPEDLAAAQKGTSPVCALNMSEPVGLMTLEVTCRMGSVWFFSRNDSDLIGPDGAITLDPAVAADFEAGKRSRDLILRRPLAWFLGGVLRYYASTEFAQPDQLEFTVSDHGNTGGVEGEDVGFCCCADRECSACSSGACGIALDVTSCIELSDLTCKDAVEGIAHLSGWQITLIAGACFACVAGSVSAVVFAGAHTRQVQLVPPDAEEADAVGGKLNGSGKHLLEEGRTENVLAI